MLVLFFKLFTFSVKLTSCWGALTEIEELHPPTYSWNHIFISTPSSGCFKKISFQLY